MSFALVRYTLVYVLGIGLGDALHIGEARARLAVLWALGTMGASLIINAACVGRAQRLWGGKARLFGRLTLLGGALALGLVAQARRPPELSASTFAVTEAWRYEGRVISGLVHSARGPAFCMAIDKMGPLASATLQAVQPPLLAWIAVEGTPLEPLWPGDRLRVATVLRSPRELLHSGGVNRQLHLASLGVSAIAFVSSAALLRLDDAFAPPVYAGSLGRELKLALLRKVARIRARLLGAVRLRLLRSFELATELESSAAFASYSLVVALALGEREPLLRADAARAAVGHPTLEAIFRGAGIIHLLSVSGLHLAVASFVFYRGLAWLLLFISSIAQRWVARRIAALCAVPAVIFYTLLTGAELPTVRAAVASVLSLLGIACGRRAGLPAALAVAVLWIARPDPDESSALSIYEPSLLLSYAATLAIAYVRPLLWLLGRTPRWLRLPVRLMDATLGATMATMPLCAYYFAEAQLAGLIGNLVAVPIGEFIVLPSGLLGAIWAALWPTLPGSKLLLYIAAGAAAVMRRMAEALAALKLGGAVYAPSTFQVALWMVGLGVLAAAKKRRWLGWGALGVALGLYLGTACKPLGHLEVTFLDVGQGDAAVIELPSGKVVVIDAGPLATTRGAKSPAEAVVVPFLHRRGHRRIDLLIASHRHPDHFGGMFALLAQFDVGVLWLPPGAIADAPQKIAAFREEVDWRHLREAAQHRGISIVVPQSQSLDGVAFDVLAPCQNFRAAMSADKPGCMVAAPPMWSENDRSLVLRLGYAGRRVLFAGDLELTGELALLEDAEARRALDEVNADVLKAPHHCSSTSSSESFVKAVAPSWVVCSLGRHNRFGFPHDEVLSRYAQIGSTVLRTDESGAIGVTILSSGTLRVAALVN